MVDKLCGYSHSPHGPKRPYKLVHLLPISVDVPSDAIDTSADQANSKLYDSSTSPEISANLPSTSINAFGGRLEELFLASSHAKMYVAINTVAIAPCIVGKSTMFRRSHLDSLTTPSLAHSPSSDHSLAHYAGLDYFSQNICEDHLIGDLLWKSSLPIDTEGRKHRNHGLVLGDLAIQPVAGMSVGNYIARRVRWLRVRKFTVPAATLVEPGTESMLCSLMGAWGVTSSKYTKDWAVGLAAGDSHTWGGWWPLLAWWTCSMMIWSFIDWTNYLLLHSGATAEVGADHDVPLFARPPPGKSRVNEKPIRADTAFQGHWKLRARRRWVDWARAWLGREALAFPIWFWAIWGGVTVTWRERRFWVGWDMRVHEVDEAETKISSSDNKESVNHDSQMNGHTCSTDHEYEAGNDSVRERERVKRRKTKER